MPEFVSKSKPKPIKCFGWFGPNFSSADRILQKEICHELLVQENKLS